MSLSTMSYLSSKYRFPLNKLSLVDEIKKIKFNFLVFEPFNDQCASHIETSQLICSVN